MGDCLSSSEAQEEEDCLGSLSKCIHLHIKNPLRT